MMFSCESQDTAQTTRTHASCFSTPRKITIITEDLLQYPTRRSFFEY